MTVSALKNQEELKRWILRRLGAPLLKVELTAEHLDDNFWDAHRWFSAKKGFRKQMIINISSGQNEYQLPDECDTVYDVVFAANPLDLSMIFSPYILQGDKVPYDVFAAPQSVGLYSSFTQTIMYVQTAKRILGADPDWRQEGNKLYLFPVPASDYGMILDFKSHEFTVEQLNERDYDLVRRWALALAKRDLGEIRTKYDSYPTAQGAVNLNGSQLLQEAQAEMDVLNDEIAQSGYPMGFLHG
jgi:hypothetical protein